MAIGADAVEDTFTSRDLRVDAARRRRQVQRLHAHVGLPPRGSINSQVTAGEGVFNSIGCADCHVATLTSGASSIAALANKTYHPYSDFLLHDMGTSGDGIGAMGRATTTEMRTAPLWGLRTVESFWHAGNAVSISEAIQRHRGHNTAATRFNTLSSTQTTQILAFLNSL